MVVILKGQNVQTNHYKAKISSWKLCIASSSGSFNINLHRNYADVHSNSVLCPRAVGDWYKPC
jgi:hypothetical protein